MVQARKAEYEKACRKATKKGKTPPTAPPGLGQQAGGANQIMITPYRHNWLISGTEAGETADSGAGPGSLQTNSSSTWYGFLAKEFNRLFWGVDSAEDPEPKADGEPKKEEEL